MATMNYKPTTPSRRNMVTPSFAELTKFTPEKSLIDTTRTAITDERKNDYINFLIPSVGSPELPFVVAAKGLLDDIITTADSNPPQNYKGQLKCRKRKRKGNEAKLQEPL